MAVSGGMPEGEAAVGSIKSGGHAQPLKLEAGVKSSPHYHALQCSCSVQPFFFKIHVLLCAHSYIYKIITADASFGGESNDYWVTENFLHNTSMRSFQIRS